MGFTDNPIINSPFDAPAFHYELDEEGQPTGVKLPGRRQSIQVVPVPAARRRGPRQAELDLFEHEGAKVTPNARINEIRKHVDQWRALPSSQWGVSPETQRLLLHWREPSRGYLPFSASGGALLFHLLSKLYERASVIITTNLSASASGRPCSATRR
jgi:type III restriction enzyme